MGRYEENACTEMGRGGGGERREDEGLMRERCGNMNERQLKGIDRNEGR